VEIGSQRPGAWEGHGALRNLALIFRTYGGIGDGDVNLGPYSRMILGQTYDIYYDNIL